jgi:uncharacterized membrane protein YccC
MGVALALAAILYHTILLQPVERGYWIALTVILVLRPDFSTTLTRGIARIVGTLLGAVLMTLLISQLAPSQAILVLIDAIVGYLAFSFLFVNYALFSVFVTIEVVILLAFVSSPVPETAIYRAINTVIGGALALLIFFLWPTWDRARVPEQIAKRLEALANYLSLVLRAYANPDEQNKAEIDNAHKEVRLARSSVEGAVQNALQEPGRYRLNTEIVRGLLGTADGIAQSTITLEAYLVDNPEYSTLPEINIFAEKAQKTLDLLAQAVREQRSVTEALPDLEEALQCLKHARITDRRQQKDFAVEQKFVTGEAKQIVRNMHIMKQLLAYDTTDAKAESGT